MGSRKADEEMNVETVVNVMVGRGNESKSMVGRGNESKSMGKCKENGVQRAKI